MTSCSVAENSRDTVPGLGSIWGNKTLWPGLEIEFYC